MSNFQRVSATRFEGAIGTLERLSPHIVGVEMNLDVEIDADGMRAIQRCMHELIDSPPIAHLVDRRTPYSLSHGAQARLANDEELVAVAYLVDNAVSETISEYAEKTYLKGVAVRAFTRRDRAIAWLEEVVEKSRQETSHSSVQ